MVSQVGEVMSHHETSETIPEVGEQTGQVGEPETQVQKTDLKDKEAGLQIGETPSSSVH